MPLRDEAFFWLLYYCGVRKSEAYERVVGDFKIMDGYLVVDFHRRKKGGAEVPPLQLPLDWYGIDKIVQNIRIEWSSKPKKEAVCVYADRKRVRTLRKDRWVFPRIQSTKAGK